MELPPLYQRESKLLLLNFCCSSYCSQSNYTLVSLIRQTRKAQKNLGVKTRIDIFYLLRPEACASKGENHVDRSLHTSKASVNELSFSYA